MRKIFMVRALPFLPAAWVSSWIYAKKSEEESQARLKKWSQLILKVLGLHLEINGQENIPKDRTVYFVSNHQGTLDPALILASCPVPVAFISKKENEKMPIFGRWAQNIGTLHFDRDSREGNVHMLREAGRKLKKGKNLLIFPEGTRSKADAMHEFKAGALLPAYMAKAVIVPVVLHRSYILDVNEKISKNLKIEYGKPIDLASQDRPDQEMCAKQLHDWIQGRIEISAETSDSC